MYAPTVVEGTTGFGSGFAGLMSPLTELNIRAGMRRYGTTPRPNPSARSTPDNADGGAEGETEIILLITGAAFCATGTAF